MLAAPDSKVLDPPPFYPDRKHLDQHPHGREKGSDSFSHLREPDI